MHKYGADFFGTFWLVLGGCGSAVIAAAFPALRSISSSAANRVSRGNRSFVKR